MKTYVPDGVAVLYTPEESARYGFHSDLPGVLIFHVLKSSGQKFYRDGDKWVTIFDYQIKKTYPLEEGIEIHPEVLL